MCMFEKFLKRTSNPISPHELSSTIKTGMSLPHHKDEVEWKEGVTNKLITSDTCVFTCMPVGLVTWLHGPRWRVLVVDLQLLLLLSVTWRSISLDHNSVRWFSFHSHNYNSWRVDNVGVIASFVPRLDFRQWINACWLIDSTCSCIIYWDTGSHLCGHCVTYS